MRPPSLRSPCPSPSPITSSIAVIRASAPLVGYLRLELPQNNTTLKQLINLLQAAA